jgi:hypothetical protein
VVEGDAESLDQRPEALVVRHHQRDVGVALPGPPPPQQLQPTVVDARAITAMRLGRSAIARRQRMPKGRATWSSQACASPASTSGRWNAMRVKKVPPS